MREYIPVSIEVVSPFLINVVFLHEGKEVTSPFDANKRVDAASGKHKISKITSLRDDDGIINFLIEFENYVSSIECRIDDAGELIISGEGELPGSFADGETKMLLVRFLNDFHNAVK